MKCAIYARVSSASQREKQTIAAQLRVLPEYARQQKWTIVETYVDDGASATKDTLDERPAFRRLLEDAEKKRFDVLLVTALDRITRADKSVNSALIYDTIRTCGVRIAQPNRELINLDNEDQDFVVGVIREIGKWEARKIRARTRAGKIEAAKQGARDGSRRASSLDPYGLVWSADARRYEIEPTEAKAVRRMYDLAIEGHGLVSIAAILGAEGHRTRAIKRRTKPTAEQTPISRNTIRKLLRSTTYRGEFLQFTRSERIAIKVPPIVSPETWDRAQAALSERKPETKWKHDRTYLLSGLAVCGVCGSSMWVMNAKGYVAHRSSAYYRCSSSNGWRRMGMEGPCGNRFHRVDAVDLAVWRRVREILTEPKLLKRACKLSNAPNNDPTQLQALETSLGGLERSSAETLRRSRAGLISDAVADQALREISTERKSVERSIARLRAAAQSSAARTERVHAIEETAARLALAHATFLDRRRVMTLLVPRSEGCKVILHDRSVQIVGVIPIPGEAVHLSTSTMAAPSLR